MGVKCNAILPLLSSLADNELPAPDIARVQHHLASCPACAVQLQEYQALNGFLVAPDPIEPSPYTWSHIRRRLHEKPVGRTCSLLGRLRPVLLPLGAAAMLAVGIFAAGELSRTLTDGSRQVALDAVNGEQGSVPVNEQFTKPDTTDLSPEYQEYQE